VTSSQRSATDIVMALIGKQLNFGGRELKPDDDLWNLGMSSITCMGLMLEIEDTFGIELPEERLNHTTFSCVNGIVAAVECAKEYSVPADGAEAG
jgi:acyl carrier protein